MRTALRTVAHETDTVYCALSHSMRKLVIWRILDNQKCFISNS